MSLFTTDFSKDSSVKPSRRWIVASKIEDLRRRVVTLEKVLSQLLDILGDEKDLKEDLEQFHAFLKYDLNDSEQAEKLAGLKKMLRMGFDERNGGTRK